MKGQIWVETAVYTLIGLALIGMVLAFAMPKIQSAQEKASIEQTLNAFESLDSVINEVIATGAGNTRVYYIQFKKGELMIDSEHDFISFSLREMKSPYSQPNRTIESGKIEIETLKMPKNYQTILKLNYTYFANIVLNGNEEQKRYPPAPTDYKFLIFNNGTNAAEDKIVIDIQEA